MVLLLLCLALWGSRVSIADTSSCHQVKFITDGCSYAETDKPPRVEGLDPQYADEKLPVNCYRKKGYKCTVEVCSPQLTVHAGSNNGWMFKVEVDGQPLEADGPCAKARCCTSQVNLELDRANARFMTWQWRAPPAAITEQPTAAEPATAEPTTEEPATYEPTVSPTRSPTLKPTTAEPTAAAPTAPLPTAMPTPVPTTLPPTAPAPTVRPTLSPVAGTPEPTPAPTVLPPATATPAPVLAEATPAPVPDTTTPAPVPAEATPTVMPTLSPTMTPEPTTLPPATPAPVPGVGFLFAGGKRLTFEALQEWCQGIGPTLETCAYCLGRAPATCAEVGCKGSKSERKSGTCIKPKKVGQVKCKKIVDATVCKDTGCKWRGSKGVCKGRPFGGGKK